MRSEVKLTKVQLAAMVFASERGQCMLMDYLDAGHSLVTLVALNKRQMMAWTSTYTIPTCVTPSEYLEARDTTSYVDITDLGRSALTQTDGEGKPK